jgi:carbon storage regulator
VAAPPAFPRQFPAISRRFKGFAVRNLLDAPLETFTVKEFAEPSTVGSAQPRNGPMLVLSRKKDESIVINNDITIVVVEIRGDKVRLGVEAPKEVPVHRREVFEAIARGETVDAAAVTTPGVDAVESDSALPEGDSPRS